MKKWNDVTSLERSAMARIKGGGSLPAKCAGNWKCQGGPRNAVNVGNAVKVAESTPPPKEDEVEEEKED